MINTDPRVNAESCDIYFVRHLEAKTIVKDGQELVRTIMVDGKPKTEKALCGGAKPGSYHDTELTAESVAKTQALSENLIEKIGQNNIGAVYSSPMRRTQQTLAPLAAKLKLPMQEDGRLDELSHGELLDAGAAWHDHPAWKAYKPKSRLEKLTTPQAQGAESNCEVIDRMKSFAFETAEKHLGKAIVCCSHDGAMRALLNLRNIEQAYGKTLGKQSSADAVRTLQAKTDVKLPEARHFEKGEVLHIRVTPSKGQIEILESPK